MTTSTELPAGVPTHVQGVEVIATERVPCNLPPDRKTGELYHYKRVVKLLLANDEETYCCTDCGLTNSNAMKVRAHVATHTYYKNREGESDRPYRRRAKARREAEVDRWVEEIIDQAEGEQPIDDDDGEDGGEITALDLLNIVNEVEALRTSLAETTAERDDLRRKLTLERRRLAEARKSRDQWKTKHDLATQELAEHRSLTAALRRLQATARSMG